MKTLFLLMNKSHFYFYYALICLLITPAHIFSQGKKTFTGNNIINVIDFGAIADAKTDNTPAFQKALDAANLADTKTVFVPAGNYLFNGTLIIPHNVTLEGVWSAPPRTEKIPAPPGAKFDILHYSGSVLLVTSGKGEEAGKAFMRMNTNSVLKGLTIFYPEQTNTNPPIPYPWTVQTAGGDNISIIDVTMVNPYQAVDFGSVPAGRHYIRGLYAQALRRGIFVDECFDVGRIENVHLWPFWTEGEVNKFILEQGEAFIFGRSDWEQVLGCFSIGYKIGFHFIKGPNGGGNYQITGGGADMADAAVLADELQAHSGATFVNCQLFGDLVTAKTNNGMLRFTGCGLFGTILGKRNVSFGIFEGNGRVSFVNCDFFPLHPASKGLTQLIFDNARVNVTACEFRPTTQTTITLGSNVKSAVIMGNNSLSTFKIQNDSKGDVHISGNVVDK